jgi:hypothetical protein
MYTIKTILYTFGIYTCDLIIEYALLSFFNFFLLCSVI